MNRRSLLIGIGAALAAPAIVKADNLMKLYVPPKPKFIMGLDLASRDDFGVEVGWLRRAGSWEIIGNYRVVNEGGKDLTVRWERNGDFDALEFGVTGVSYKRGQWAAEGVEMVPDKRYRIG